jgi:hypothetical protein
MSPAKKTAMKAAAKRSATPPAGDLDVRKTNKL